MLTPDTDDRRAQADADVADARALLVAVRRRVEAGKDDRTSLVTAEWRLNTAITRRSQLD